MAPEWNAENVWVTSERYLGECSRCGKRLEAHFGIKDYCFEPPPAVAPAGDAPKETTAWEKACALARTALRPATIAAEFGVPVERVVDALAKALLPFVFSGAVDFALDRAATWRVLGTDPEQAERDNCWLAPSVESQLDGLRAIEAAALAYKATVMHKRECEVLLHERPEKAHREMLTRAERNKKVKGEALFALLPQFPKMPEPNPCRKCRQDPCICGHHDPV